jgi:hypothetical protein
MVACNTEAENTSNQTATEVVAEVEEVQEDTMQVYPYFAGAEFDRTQAKSSDEIAAYLAAYNGDTSEVAFTANIIDNCAKKGCWMNVNIAGEPVRVKFKDYEFFVPLDAAGHQTTLNGTFNFDTLTVAHLRHLAEDANATEDSINSITEPEYSVTFMATGVYVD